MADTQQRIISADSHVTITNEAFFEHLASKYVSEIEAAIADQMAASAALNMPNNRAHRDWPAQGRPGDHVQEDRILDQIEDGVDAEVLYSQSVFGFDGGVFYKLSDEARRGELRGVQRHAPAVDRARQAAPDSGGHRSRARPAGGDQGARAVSRARVQGAHHPDLLGLLRARARTGRTSTSRCGRRSRRTRSRSACTPTPHPACGASRWPIRHRRRASSNRCRPS